MIQTDTWTQTCRVLVAWSQSSWPLSHRGSLKVLTDFCNVCFCCQEGAAAQKAADEESPLGQAYLKYMDALACDEAKAIFNFHVGRMMVVQGNYDDAVQRLETSLNWNPNYQLSRWVGMSS